MENVTAHSIICYTGLKLLDILNNEYVKGTTSMNLIIPIILLYANSVIHESGHVWAAKRAGIRIFEVCIGMGPFLFSLQSPHTGTLYTFHLLPLGGYTAMLTLPNGRKRRALHRGSLCKQPLLTQAIVLSAGFLVESLAAIALFICRMGSIGGNLNPSWTFGVCLYACSSMANMVPFGQTDGAMLHNLVQFGCIFRQPKHVSMPSARR